MCPIYPRFISEGTGRISVNFGIGGLAVSMNLKVPVLISSGPWRRLGEERCTLHTFLTSAQDVKLPLWCRGTKYGACSTGSSEDRSIVLDAMANKQLPAPVWSRNSVAHPVVQSLYRLSYADSLTLWRCRTNLVLVDIGKKVFEAKNLYRLSEIGSHRTKDWTWRNM